MTDYTRTKKIGGDSIVLFVVIQVVAGNRYDTHEQSSTGTKEIVNKATWKSTIYNNINFLVETFGSHSYGKKCFLCDV